MERLAHFCASLSYSGLPDRTREQAKMLIADSIINIVSALKLPIAPLLRSFVSELSGKPESTLIGGKKVPAPLAAFAHSAIASATQCDDTHNRSGTHISSAVVPVALAVCEQEGLGGKKLIESVVAGTEVMARVGMTLGPRVLYRKGFHPSSLCAPFGGAAASGKIFGFTPKEFLQAFGLAAVQSSGLLCGSEKGPLSWYIQYGKGAENGVVASRLGRLGANAPHNIFNNFRDFFNLFSNEPKRSFLTRDLGKVYAVEQVSKKRYPCFQFGQSTLEALFWIMEKESIAPDEISRVVGYIPAAAFKEIFRGSTFVFPPRTVLSAQTDLRFLISLAIATRGVSLKRLVEERENPSIARTARKVSVKGDETLNKAFPSTWPARVEIFLKGRRRLSHTVLYPKGDWRNPMTWEDLREKFTQVIQPQIGPKESRRLWNELTRLERVRNMKDLFPRRIYGP